MLRFSKFEIVGVSETLPPIYDYIIDIIWEMNVGCSSIQNTQL